MINLLPPKEKEELKLERREKLIIVLGNVVIISLVCLTLVLFSLKFYVLAEVNSEKIIIDITEKRYQTPEFLSLKQHIQNYNTALANLDDFYKKQVSFSDALKTILEIQRPNGLYFTNITMEKGEKGKVKVTIAGVSDTRDNLINFKSNIESHKNIENVYFPPDSWIKPADLNFYVTFEIVKNENSK